MNEQAGVRARVACGAMALTGAFAAAAQPGGASDSAESGNAIEEVVVTGSRILRDPVNEPTAIMQIDATGLERTGLTNLGDALQNLPIAGSAPNSQFNVPGNSGFPQDGSGIGAGSVQLSLRNLPIGCRCIPQDILTCREVGRCDE